MAVRCGLGAAGCWCGFERRCGLWRRRRRHRRVESVADLASPRKSRDVAHGHVGASDGDEARAAATLEHVVLHLGCTRDLACLAKSEDGDLTFDDLRIRAVTIRGSHLPHELVCSLTAVARRRHALNDEDKVVDPTFLPSVTWAGSCTKRSPQLVGYGIRGLSNADNDASGLDR